MAPKKSLKPPFRTHRSTLSLQKTEIVINVYDLLPPGRLSSLLWAIGASLLHSGVVINGREYAYGGHDRPNTTGVYWTPPRTLPPGGTFKIEILHGFTVAPQAEIDAIIRKCSDEFHGTSYNLLTRNCNHFTSYLCQKLTGRPGPGWLNRAASIGVALPCVVPRDWIEPPEWEEDGELVREEGDVVDERSSMLRRENSRDTVVRGHAAVVNPGSAAGSTTWDSDEDRRKGGNGKGKAVARDSLRRQRSEGSSSSRR